jgi:hypothetical protein
MSIQPMARGCLPGWCPPRLPSLSLATAGAAVPVPIMGRCIAGLSEAIMLRLAERDDLDHVRTTTAQMAQALSALGQVIADLRSTGDTAAGIAGPVMLAPPALLNRAARYLQAAAAMVRDDKVLPDGFDATHAGQLADTFETDALLCGTTVTARSRTIRPSSCISSARFGSHKRPGRYRPLIASAHC